MSIAFRHSQTIARVLAVIALFVLSPRVGSAQARPTPAQAQAMMQDPSVVARIQREIQSSGMSRDQIRARLRAEGYPESMLDAVMPGGSDSTFRVTDDTFAALQALGIMDSSAVSSLRGVNPAASAAAKAAMLSELERLIQNDSTRQDLERFLRSRGTQRAFADSGFEVFGRDVFERTTTQFNANLLAPVGDDYRLGPGDRLVLTLTGDVEASYPLQVNREGYVVIPNVGAPLFVANLSKGEAERLMFSSLARVYSGLQRGAGATTRMQFSVASLGTKQVQVAGDVTSPGTYTVPNSATILHALYQAGGPNATGTMRQIQLRRGGRVIGTMDLYQYLLTGNTASDVRVESGDVIFVPPRGGHVRLAGAVLRPATYEMGPGETLQNLVSFAGGFRPTADRRKLQVERIVPADERTEAGRDRRIFEIASPSLATGFGPPEPLLPGDVVRVGEIASQVTNRITVTGNVWSGGQLAFRPGMRLSDALRAAGGLKSDTYLGQITIARLEADSTRRNLRVALRDTLGNPANDIELRDFDEIQVYSLTEFRPQRWVTVGGAVHKGGRVPYREGMTLRDLVLAAEGLQEGALLTEAEVARLPESRANGVTAVTTRVPLDSTYLFERRADGSYEGPPGIPAPAARAPEIVLKAYDNVTILRQPDWSLTETVWVDGQVRYPAAYALRSKSERVSDLMQRAGGLTVEAYPSGIVFVRRRNGVGRIGIDLPAILRNPAHRDNLLLVEGDSIFIPKYVAIVQVRGAVNSPVAVPYVPGRDLDYYIRAAGGGTSQADVGKAFVTQPNGKVESRDRTALVWRSVPEPAPGATVVVPAKDPNDRRDWAQLISLWTSVLGSLVAVVAIVRR